ncbi:MAG: hypothetical protein ACXQS8_07340 [Candidatus Helarchaeales archaeon]
MMYRLYQKIYPPPDYSCFGKYEPSNTPCYYCKKAQECWEARYFKKIKEKIVDLENYSKNIQEWYRLR